MSTSEFVSDITDVPGSCHEQRKSFSSSTRRLKLATTNLRQLAVLGAYLTAALNLVVAEAKREVVITSLGGKQEEDHTRWRYLSKFGYTTGEGSYRLRAKLRNLPPAWQVVGGDLLLQVEAYVDEDWPDVESEKVGCARSGKARGLKDLLVPRNLSWGEWTDGTVHQHIRPHVWYYAISDCTRLLVGGHTFQIEFQALQPDGSHFSIEHQYTIHANVIAMSCFVLFTLFFVKGCYDFYRQTESLHPVIWTLGALMALQFLSRGLHLIHLLVYQANGNGLKPVEIYSEIVLTVAEMIQSTLLIVIALGYTLMPLKMTVELVLGLGITNLLVHIMLIALGRTDDDAANKFHHHEGICGMIMLAIRVLLYVGFHWAVSVTEKSVGSRISNFISKFRIAGSLYFLGYPVLFLVSRPFAPYVRPLILTFGLMVSQIASIFWLNRLFLTRGSYFKVSELGSSPLPGGASPGGVNKWN